MSGISIAKETVTLRGRSPSDLALGKQNPCSVALLNRAIDLCPIVIALNVLDFHPPLHILAALQDLAFG